MIGCCSQFWSTLCMECNRPSHICGTFRDSMHLTGTYAMRPFCVRLLQRGHTLKHHYLSSYRLALLAVCRLQYTVRGSPAGRAGILGMGADTPLRADMHCDGCVPCSVCAGRLGEGEGGCGCCSVCGWECGRESVGGRVQADAGVCRQTRACAFICVCG